MSYMTIYDLPEGSGRRFLFGLFGRHHDEPNCKKDGCGDCAIIVHFDREMKAQELRLRESETRYGCLKIQEQAALKERDAANRLNERLTKALRKIASCACTCVTNNCVVCVALEALMEKRKCERVSPPDGQDWCLTHDRSIVDCHSLAIS